MVWFCWSDFCHSDPLPLTDSYGSPKFQVHLSIHQSFYLSIHLPNFPFICSFPSRHWNHPSGSPSNRNANLVLWCRFSVALNQHRQASTLHKRDLTIQCKKKKRHSDNHPELEYTSLPIRLWNRHPSAVCRLVPSQSVSALHVSFWAALRRRATSRPAGSLVWSCDCHKVITNDLLSGLTLSISERVMIYRPTGILLGFIRLSWRSVIDSSGAEARPLSANADALRTEMTPHHCLLPFMSSWCNFAD